MTGHPEILAASGGIFIGVHTQGFIAWIVIGLLAGGGGADGVGVVVDGLDSRDFFRDLRVHGGCPIVRG